MICQRCTKEKDGIHTCTPSEFVRELEAQVAALTKENKRLTAIYDDVELRGVIGKFVGENLPLADKVEKSLEYLNARITKLNADVHKANSELDSKRNELEAAAIRAFAAQEQIATLTNDLDIEKRAALEWAGKYHDVEEQLAAAQAVIAEVHAWVVCAGITTPEDMAQNFDRIVEITTPSDTTALQERLAEERERCAKVCEVGAVLCDTAWADKRPNEADELDAVALTRIICAAAIRSMK